MTPLKAIRAKCLDCCAGQIIEVRLCPAEDCPIHEYRMGHNPKRKGKGGKGFQKTWSEDAMNQPEVEE